MIYKYPDNTAIDSTGSNSDEDEIIVKKVNPIIGVLLFLVSIILSCITLWFGFLIGIIYVLINGKLGEYFMEMATAIDQNGNVVMQHILNMTLVTSKGYLFGNRDETISSALGKNKELGTLSNFGKWIDGILEKIDPNHTLNSREYYVDGKNDITTPKELDLLRKELIKKFPNVNFTDIELNPKDLVPHS